MELEVAINAVEGCGETARSTIAGIRTAPQGATRRQTGTAEISAEEAGYDDHTFAMPPFMTGLHVSANGSGA